MLPNPASTATWFPPRPKCQKGFLILFYELLDSLCREPQKILDFASAAVRNAEPDKFWWMPVQNTSILKIRVLRDNCEAIIFSVLPNGRIVCAPQPAFVNMSAIWVEIG